MTMPYSTCCQIDADMLPACYRHIMVRPECHLSLLSFTESGLSIYWGRKTERHPGKKRGTFQLLSYYGPNHPQVTPARSSPGGKPRREVRGPIPPAYLCRNREALGECQVEGKEPTHLPRSESRRGEGRVGTWPFIRQVREPCDGRLFRTVRRAQLRSLLL